MNCKKCLIPIILEMSCMSNSDLEEMMNKKMVNYIVAGEGGSSILGQKQKCVKCKSEFEIMQTVQCKKCGIHIVDSKHMPNKDFTDLELKKQINYLFGKTNAVVEITCVNCSTKFNYDRNEGVVK